MATTESEFPIKMRALETVIQQQDRQLFILLTSACFKFSHQSMKESQKVPDCWLSGFSTSDPRWFTSGPSEGQVDAQASLSLEEKKENTRIWIQPVHATL